jgi:hypothetical protein
LKGILASVNLAFYLSITSLVLAKDPTIYDIITSALRLALFMLGWS